MNNLAIYCRKSKFTGKGESIENQIKKCKDFIKFKFDIDPENIEIFIDEGFSGKNENRPEYQKIITKIQSKEINSIIIYQLNRLGRNARDIHNTMQLCDDFNTIIYSATEGFDSSTSFGRAIIGILASLAQLEREQLAERVKDNMYTLAKMGRWLGGQSPLGFDGTREYYIDDSGKERSVTELKKNNEELKIIKTIYKKYLEEKSLSQVGKWSLINYLKGKNGGNLDKSSINSILQNPVYVQSNDEIFKFLIDRGYDVFGEPNGNGILRYGKDNKSNTNDDDSSPIAAVAKHKGIINPNDWLEVQNILKQNTEKAPRLGKTNTALLTGILKCSCGSGMRVSYGRSNKEGIKPFYYTCAMKNNSGGLRCNSKNINGMKLEENLINYLKLYNKDKLFSALSDLFSQTKNLESAVNVKNLDSDIDTCNKSIQKLLNKLKLTDDNEVSKIILDEIKFEKNKINDLQLKKEEMMEDQSNLVISQSEIMNIIDILDDFNKSFDTVPFEDKKKKLNNLFESIVYTNDNFEISWNLKKKLDSSIAELSSLFPKYNLSQFGISSICTLFQIAININELNYSKLPCNTFTERLKKAKLIAGFTQRTLANATNLSLSTINELEAGYRDMLTKDTLLKLLSVLDKNILCDNYCYFILDQEKEMKNLLDIYSINELSTLLSVHRTTIEHWRKCKYQVSRKQYNLISNLKGHEN